MSNYRKLTLSAAVALSSLQLMAQNIKVDVEPANWWVGMNNPKVQVLLHAKEVSAMQPNVAAEGVTITNVIRTDNPDYMFVDLHIGKDAKPGTIQIDLKGKSKKKSAKVPFELKSRREGSAQRQGFGPEDAIMLIMPDRFANGNPDNDNMPGLLEKADRSMPYGRHGGDIQGVIDHIDYFKKMGMTTLWLNPVTINDLEASTYHGYATTDFYKIDPRLGTNEDYARLSAELHKNGMKNIMDQVLNHCGTTHMWARQLPPNEKGIVERDMPHKNWLNIWRDKEGKEILVKSNFRLSTIMDPHASEADKESTLKGWFDTTMADINLADSLVLTYMAQNSIWWVEYADLDGIRVDTYPYSDPFALKEWNDRVRAEYPNINIVGEVWITEPAQLYMWQENNDPSAKFNNGLKSIMDFPLADKLPLAMREQAGWGEGAFRLYEHFASDYIYYDPMNMFIFGENHDKGRLLTHLDNDTSALRLTMALLATVRGMPQLYYGTEMLMTGEGEQGHCNMRVDFPGGWEGDKENYFVTMPKAQKEMYDYISTIFNYRKTSPALTHGTMTHYLPEQNVYVYMRKDAKSGQRVLVMLNLDKQPVDVNLKKICDLHDGILQGKNIIDGRTINVFGSIKLDPREAMIIELQ